MPLPEQLHVLSPSLQMPPGPQSEATQQPVPTAHAPLHTLSPGPHAQTPSAPHFWPGMVQSASPQHLAAGMQAEDVGQPF
jgi:hypothetical protein